MSTTIRLRLVIRRHAVPEVKLVWPCVANDDLTVARLLALVNEVVPLESGDWGLEDYVVELYDGKGDSFELLHFQPAGKVLKEDDQVLIRSLSTDDIRRRKLSGRHQISDDGKHLIDGLAFGRPWLRAPRDRPALDLPPRKRARITHEEELDEDDNDDSYVDEEDQSEQLLLEDSVAPENEEPGSVRLRVRFLDSDQVEEENEDENLEDENDFQPIEEVHAEPAVDEEDEDDAESSDEDDLDADLSDELRLLQEDNAIVEQIPAKEQETLLRGDDSQDPQALLPTHGFDVSWLDKITALRAAFPLTPVSTLQDEMNRNKDLRKTYERLSEANKPVISYDEALERVLLGPGFSDALSLDQSTDVEEDPEDRVLLLPGQAEPKDATRPLIQEIEEEPAPVSTPRLSQNQSSRPLISEIPNEEEDTSSSSSSSDSSSDSDSDADSDVDMEEKSDSESDSDADDSDGDSSDDSDFPAPTPSRPAKTTQQDSEDSDSSDSDSDSDSDSSSDPSKGAGATKDSAESDPDDSSDSSSDSDSSSSESDSESEPEEISSKKQPQTKQPQHPTKPELELEPEPKTNGQTAKAAPEPGQGPKPPGTGLAKTQKRNARKRDAKRLKAMQALEDTQSQPSVNSTASEEAELLARKRALLSAVSDEQEDEPSLPKDAPNKETRPMIVEVEVEEQPPAATTSQDVAPVEEEPVPAHRRHKVDMGAGRRLLLGALGLKNPKTKADEDKLRHSLMKSVKPLQNPRVKAEEVKANDDKPAEEQPDEDPEAWRKKISYRAVECGQDDIVLSEPPFPFVQRWDPQQQYGSMRKRKRASQNFNDDSYYEEDSQQWKGDEEWNENSQRKKKKNKKRKNKGGHDGDYDEEESREDSFGGRGANGDEDIVLNYDDIPAKHRPEESQFTDTEDLPSLPSDVSTLPSLVLSDMKPGMVATWKQLVMSKATNWQPEMVPMTGLILSISEDNCMHVLLAMRDREGNDKEYDEHTGQRIYAKFEAPDLDEDEEDDGRREIPWAEMSDPRLVQPAPPPAMLETSAKSIKLQAEQNKPVQNGNSTADNKVSARTNPDETVAEELDTQKVRAEVEADLMGQETEGKPSGTDKSTSIPSGQQPPRLDFPASGNDSPISSFVQHAVPFGKYDSHLHQLEESMQASTSQLQSLLSRDSDKGKDDNEGEKTGIDESDRAKDAKESEGEPVPTVEGSWDAVIPDTIPSPELPPLPTKGDALVDHRLLVVPSSAGSVRSGRQPPSVSGLDDLPEERIEESVEGGIVDDSHGRSASPQVRNESRPRSSSPFPSLEEIFHTARQTQSPFKFSQMSVPQFIKSERKDGDYEEAMRKLDEGEESDRSPDRNKSLRSLLPNATQPESQKGSPLVRSFKSEGIKPEASEPRHSATPPASQKVKQEPQFAIPEGSQVIELSSSPPSVQYAEDYAQDSEDETYQDSPLPQGSGWVQKKHSEVNTRSRGKSLPATEAKKTTTVQSRTIRGQTSAPVAREVSTSAYSQIKGRRKTTRKF